MLSLRSLDPIVPIERQLEASLSPVVLINVFTVAPADVESLLTAWAQDANWMKRQRGFISTQLHRGIAGSCVFLNYAIWESVDHFRAAFTHPEFANALSAYPSSAVATPHLFSRVAVPNICVA
jgi:heme-degrading monooxygenase HmoA